MTTTEQFFCKITLFLIRDWDSFQLAMRSCLHSTESVTHKISGQG